MRSKTLVLLLPILLVAGFLIVPNNLVPQAHALPANGTICLVDPVSVNSLAPCNAPLANSFTGMQISEVASGRVQLRVAVMINASATMNGFDITLLTNHNILQPFDADLTGGILPAGANVLAKCIGGILKGGSACSTTDNADTLRLSAAAQGFFSPTVTTGLLFTAVYNVVGNAPPAIVIGYQTGCGTALQPTSNPPNCVTIENGTNQAVPESILTATYVTAAAAGTTPFFDLTTTSPNFFNEVQGGTAITFSTTLTAVNGFNCGTLVGGAPCIDVGSMVTTPSGIPVNTPPSVSIAPVGPYADGTTLTVTVSSTAAIPFGNYTISIIGRPDTTSTPSAFGTGTTYLGAVLNFTVRIWGITIATSPTSVNVVKGTTTSVNFQDVITLTSQFGFTGSATLSARVATGVVGYTFLFNSTTVAFTAGITKHALLTTTIASTAAVTNTTITVTAVTGGRGFSATIVVHVTDFAIAANPTIVSITQGGAASSTTITLTGLNHFVGTVTLSTNSTSFAPAGSVTVTCIANSLLFNGQATNSTSCSISASASAPTGNFHLNFTGVSGPASHSTVIALTINPGAVSHTTTTAASCTSPIVVNQGSTCTA